MTPYYLFWAMLIAASLWVSIAGFLWAHRHGQFRDQERARYLPLRNESMTFAAEKGRGARREVYVMLIILAVGLSGLLAVFIMTVAKVLEERL
jgi:nitrogen fixation-related uncharacterized protein